MYITGISEANSEYCRSGDVKAEARMNAYMTAVTIRATTMLTIETFAKAISRYKANISETSYKSGIIRHTDTGTARYRTASE